MLIGIPQWILIQMDSVILSTKVIKGNYIIFEPESDYNKSKESNSEIIFNLGRRSNFLLSSSIGLCPLKAIAVMVSLIVNGTSGIASPSSPSEPLVSVDASKRSVSAESISSDKSEAVTSDSAVFEVGEVVEVVTGIAVALRGWMASIVVSLGLEEITLGGSSLVC